MDFGREYATAAVAAAIAVDDAALPPAALLLRERNDLLVDRDSGALTAAVVGGDSSFPDMEPENVRDSQPACMPIN